MAGLYPPQNHNIKRFMEGVDPCHFIEEKVTSMYKLLMPYDTSVYMIVANAVANQSRDGCHIASW